MDDVSDVLIVGGGIAGSALACALASAGRSVTVLESSVEYEDHVRGESLMPWGVKEARNLGVEQVLLDAGAHVAPTWLQYVEGSDEPAMLPMSMMIEGIQGALNMRHPDACQALIAAAAAAGAAVVRGVHDVRMRAGQPVSVSYYVAAGRSSQRRFAGRTPRHCSKLPGGQGATRYPAWCRRDSPPGLVPPIPAMTPGLTRPLRTGLSWLATRQDITTPSSVRACRSHCGTLGSSGT